MNPNTLRRHPIEIGSRVRDMENKTGFVKEIFDSSIPEAVVDFDDGSRVRLALGYLERI